MESRWTPSIVFRGGRNLILPDFDNTDVHGDLFAPVDQPCGLRLIRRFHERWPKASLHALEGLSTSLQE
ncbi:hypothetical protein D3C85_604970 [compost metagenome]